MSGYRDEIEALAQENAALRRENEELRQQAARSPAVSAPKRNGLGLVAVAAVSAMLIAGGAAGLLAARASHAESVERRVSAPAPLAPALAEAGTVSVTLRSDGSIVLDGESSTREQFSTQIRVLGGVQPNMRVVLSADRSVSYARVIEVMDEVRTAGFSRVSMSTNAQP